MEMIDGQACMWLVHANESAMLSASRSRCLGLVILAAKDGLIMHELD